MSLVELVTDRSGARPDGRLESRLLDQGDILQGTWARALDDLHDATNAPVTSRRPWLSAAARSRPADAGSLFAILASTDPAAADAAIVLARRSVAGSLEITGPGLDPADRVSLHARDEAAGRAVVDALVRFLLAVPTHWRLSLPTLCCDEPIAARMRQLIPNAELSASEPIPAVSLGRGPDWEAYLTKGMRRSVRRGRRHIDIDGVDAGARWDRDPVAIDRLLPCLWELRSRRAVAAGRAADGDDRQLRGSWSGLIATHAALHQVEVGTFVIDGAPAAYTIGFIDGTTYRVFDGRHDAVWGRYSPGRILESELIGRAARSGFTSVDWMSSLAPEALIAATADEPTLRLTASRRSVTRAHGAAAAYPSVLGFNSEM